jgi:pyruvate/2-oxoglutarate/acetoin dehydrogenase E1 component/TPP-dependent pyruvate/acetoin dehydrogenase alpha subunit
MIRSDYRIAFRSRRASIVGRREVLAGRAKFGVFGDGKELPGLAMARAFHAGDWRSGYYRDQTLLLASSMLDLRGFFGQLYGASDIQVDPASGGRQMNNHFASRLLDDAGLPRRQVTVRNSSADISCMAGWMPRLLGLAYASKLYRQNPELRHAGRNFSDGGNEVAFGSIGDASTSEGLFWETINAAAVLQVPMMLTVYDDGYGISVPTSLQTVKGSISEALQGFVANEHPGLDVAVVQGWDYVALCDAYLTMVGRVRCAHSPALLHVVELTQPQGHSTSGSQERYKSAERIAWERDHDCLERMRRWLLDEHLADEGELTVIETEETALVELERERTWEQIYSPARGASRRLRSLVEHSREKAASAIVDQLAVELGGLTDPTERQLHELAIRALLALHDQPEAVRADLEGWARHHTAMGRDRYRSHLHSQSEQTPLRVPKVPPRYSASSPTVDGRVVLQKCFDANLARDSRIFVIGEDVGRLGDVNLVYEGLAARYGDLRVTDTGIREATILGQAIGAALRGLRPVADIQYLDYLLYALQIASDDLASLHWRTRGGQAAPVVIRTKGHRFVGVWHAGSPMATVLHSCRGIYLAVPRDMTRAAGFYNTFFRGDNPAIVIEVLRGYRLKETLPDNVGTFCLPLGQPEVLREGTDVTVVTYGACCAIALDAATDLAQIGIEVEVIDIQTLSPFDVDGRIAASIAKTSAVVFLDEDVPGGASAYMMQQTLEEHGAWEYLDGTPRTVTASPTRSAYGTDGEYFTKPGREDVVTAVYGLMNERAPVQFPAHFG